MFAIDAATRQVTSLRVEGRTAAPAAIEADETTGRIFLSYAREIVSVDATSGAVRGRVVTQEPAAIAFDPGPGLLLATRYTAKEILAFRPTDTGLEPAGRMSWAGGLSLWLEPTRNGFVQAGEMTSGVENSDWRSASLVIWTLAAR